jgi:hypothetical protein
MEIYMSSDMPSDKYGINYSKGDWTAQLTDEGGLEIKILADVYLVELNKEKAASGLSFLSASEMMLLPPHKKAELERAQNTRSKEDVETLSGLLLTTLADLLNDPNQEIGAMPPSRWKFDTRFSGMPENSTFNIHRPAGKFYRELFARICLINKSPEREILSDEVRAVMPKLLQAMTFYEDKLPRRAPPEAPAPRNPGRAP